jgi:hypothetical protein
VPPTAVATGVRSPGTDSGGRPIWFDAELMDADEAAKRYTELTSLGAS